MDKNKHTMDLLYISCTPRWKWFQPPLWKCFMWAYKIEKQMLFTNAYPKSIKVVDSKESTQDSLEINFQPSVYNNEKVNGDVEKMLENWRRMIEDVVE